jgi:hypothetical protein
MSFRGFGAPATLVRSTRNLCRLQHRLRSCLGGHPVGPSACPMQPWATPPRPKDRTRNRSVGLAHVAPPCTGLHTARVSRPREKAPRNPNLRPLPGRENAGQAPVPYAQDAPTSASMVAGETGELATSTLRGRRIQEVTPLTDSGYGHGRSWPPYRLPSPNRSTALDPARWISPPSIMAVTWSFAALAVFV